MTPAAEVASWGYVLVVAGALVVLGPLLLVVLVRLDRRKTR